MPLTVQECIVCSEERGFNEYPRIGHPLAHEICLICLQKYLDTKIVTDGVTEILCPETSCKAPLRYTDIQTYSGPEAFDR